MTNVPNRFVALLLTYAAFGIGIANSAPLAEPPFTPNLPPIVMGNSSGPQGDSWDSTKMLPNFTGAWNFKRPGGTGRGYGDDTRGVPFTPAFAKTQAEVMAVREKGEEVPSTTSRCFPTGMPMMMTSPHGLLEFLLTPGRLHIISEDGNLRRIYTDGRKVDPDPDLSFSGNSIGYWDNGALFVDTRGMDPRNQIFYGLVGGGNMHIQEKMLLTDPNTLSITRTITDPNSFTAPWTVVFTYTRSKATARESLCIQNNRDIDSESGNVGFSLEPPPGLLKPPGVK